MRACRCEKHMLEALNEGTCLWCGYGDVDLPPVRSMNSRRALPRDLGELQRKGIYPDPRLDNVIPGTTAIGVVVPFIPRPAACREKAA